MDVQPPFFECLYDIISNFILLDFILEINSNENKIGASNCITFKPSINSIKPNTRIKWGLRSTCDLNHNFSLDQCFKYTWDILFETGDILLTSDSDTYWTKHK